MSPQLTSMPIREALELSCIITMYSTRHSPRSWGTAYQAGPSHAHYRAMLDVMRYVGAIAARGITYGTSNDAVSCWCDSNFATCLDNRQSTTGYVATTYGGAITWSS
jgi:hypothetical protein